MRAVDRDDNAESLVVSTFEAEDLSTALASSRRNSPTTRCSRLRTLAQLGSEHGRSMPRRRAIPRNRSRCLLSHSVEQP